MKKTQRKAFSEINRVLKPGATMMLFEMNVDSFLVKNYLNYLFPILRNIDDGTEAFISPRSVQSLSDMNFVGLTYFGFTPDFFPAAGLTLFRSVERRLETSFLRGSSVHYLAQFTTKSEH
jgi:hypothetical protein